MNRIPTIEPSSSSDDVIVHVRRGHVLAEAGPLVASGRTMDEALERLSSAHQLYRLLLVRPHTTAAQRLAVEINELYAA
jgi:hypothetical protein